MGGFRARCITTNNSKKQFLYLYQSDITFQKTPMKSIILLITKAYL